LGGGLTEGTVLGHHRGELAPVFGMRREAVRGEGVGNGVHGAAQ